MRDPDEAFDDARDPMRGPDVPIDPALDSRAGDDPAPPEADEPVISLDDAGAVPLHAAAVPLPLPASIEEGAVPRPWGGWATVGWTALVVVGMFLVMVIGVIIYVATTVSFEGLGTDRDAAVAMIESQIRLTPVLLIGAVGSLAMVPMVMGLVRMRGLSLRRYLALRGFSWRALGVCLAVMLAYQFLIDRVTTDVNVWVEEQEQVVGSDDPAASVEGDATGAETEGITMLDLLIEEMVEPWNLAAIAVVVVIVAPLSEEIVFRGFMHTGLEASRVGPIGAIVISATCWAVIHLQYTVIGIGGILVLGLMLGIVRHRTRSVPLCIVLHTVWNGVVIAQMSFMSRAMLPTG